MDALDYSTLIPPIAALVIGGMMAFRNRADRTLRGFFGTVGLLTILLEAIWFAGFCAYSLWRQPARLELWVVFAMVGPATWFIVRGIWKSFALKLL